VSKLPVRQCISCRKQLTRDGFLRIVRSHDASADTNKLIMSPDKHSFGRSAYLCKSAECITLAIKEKKIAKMLRINIKSLEDIKSDLEFFLNSIHSEQRKKVPA